MSWQELEHQRGHLNHDHVKNRFLGVIGNARQDLTVLERSRWIMIAWDAQLGIQQADMDEEQVVAICDTVSRGLGNWTDVRSRLQDFLNRAPQQCGYQGTMLFQETRKTILEKAIVISQFVEKFTKRVFNNFFRYEISAFRARLGGLS
jgi:hypothetical protein